MNPMWFFIAIFAGTAAFMPMETLHLMIKHRDSKRFSLLVALWQLFLFLLVVEFWTASVDVESSVDTIGKFFLFLLLPVGVMLMTQLSKPDFGDDASEVDEESAFFHHRYWFFGTLALLPIISLLREVTNGESVPLDADLLFRMVILSGAIIGMFLRDRGPRIVHVVVMLIVLLTYTFVVYPNIGMTD